jgi:hypothetical protein
VGEAEFGKKRDASSTVARYGSAVAKDEPPAFGPLFLWNGCEQEVGLPIGEREQGQLLSPVESGDEPRRPAAELSTPGIE